MSDESRQRWHKSPWWGWMWGRVPVPFILFVLVLAGVLLYFYTIAE